VSEAQSNEPPWLAAWRNGGQAAQPTLPGDAPRTAAGRFVPGHSGNAAGKAPGTKQRRTVLAEHFDQGIDAIIAVVKDRALKGDLQAAALVLARAVPPKRAVAERVSFPLDTTAPRHEQVAQIVAAVAAGELGPDDGKLLIECIAAAANLAKLDHFETLLMQMQEQLAAMQKTDGTRGGVVEVPLTGEHLPGAPIYPSE